MITLKEFKEKINIKDVDGNRTYLLIEIDGFKYGQSFQNTVNSLENMKDHFTTVYYQMYQDDFNRRLESDEEKYLFEVAEAVLKWAGVKDYTREDLADLVMQELSNIKKEK